ncbi:MAG TPA: thiamine pyrophosphate-dependent enzyme [Segeticoccus sp.]|uniref:thiamine pyrophosphate-dependent enzyme n=1 Tax=Segeticoccus sp. TaxID=2706531 RepID=UPI002D7EB81A|nr:thiamine pyrophosphate-dependent enzyme [Segeticoccus sp.]HET8600669.1 thiamine pyrophosphate-dependent enzyme [Segeticoccus sp.]
MSSETLDVDARFVEVVRGMSRTAGEGGGTAPDRLPPERLLRLFDAQLGSRHLDLAARWMQARGRGYYTIGSSGHEGNVAVADALRPTDPALLHYRSGAFYLGRAAQVPGHDGLRDVLMGVAASAREPISGGRHKVFGHPALHVLPQTSTIASHLPRAVGVAFSIERAKKLGVATPWPTDAVAVCSFGDASVNHSTAVGALNAAMQATFQGLPMPVLFVCEDNGIGISVRTPKGWVEANYAHRPGLAYFAADGCDLADAVQVAGRAAAHVRRRRSPAFLHLRTVRLLGHAGSDVESAYRTPAEIRAELDHDPLLRTAQLVVDAGILTPEEVVATYEAKREQVRAIALEVLTHPTLTSRAEVVAPLQPGSDHRPAREDAVSAASPERRGEVFGGRLPEDEGPLTLAQSINRALADVLAGHREAIVLGEDVGRKGGVYGVTRGLATKVGRARVFDTLLDEQTILGLSLGAGVAGLLPIPEIQYLAYLHNAEDQLRGEAASLPFFANRQYLNPMVVRIASFAYQKGFGGHFHNDSSVAVLRDIPGLVIAVPARPDDAPAMLRTCVAAAQVEGRVCAFLEPIALYHTKDLHEEGDGQWLAPYREPDAWRQAEAPLGRGRTHGEGADLTIVSFGNGVHMSLRVAKRLEARGVRSRVLDLRWLAPLPVEDLLREANATGRVLVVDETRQTGGVGEGVVDALRRGRYAGSLTVVAGADSYVPLGDAANLVLVSEDEIEQAARDLVVAGDRGQAPNGVRTGTASPLAAPRP